MKDQNQDFIAINDLIWNDEEIEKPDKPMISPFTSHPIFSSCGWTTPHGGCCPLPNDSRACYP